MFFLLTLTDSCHNKQTNVASSHGTAPNRPMSFELRELWMRSGIDLFPVNISSGLRTRKSAVRKRERAGETLHRKLSQAELTHGSLSLRLRPHTVCPTFPLNYTHGWEMCESEKETHFRATEKLEAPGGLHIIKQRSKKETRRCHLSIKSVLWCISF